MIFDYEDIEDASFDVNLPCDIKLLRIYADMLSKEECVKLITSDYLESDDFDESLSLSDIKNEILEIMYVAVREHNRRKGKAYRWSMPSGLYESQIADILIKKYHICRIAFTDDEENELLALYQSEGVNEGIYVTRESIFNELIRQFNYTITSKSIQEVIAILRDSVERNQVCTDPDLIAFNNGIFNYKTKQLMPFSHEYIFLNKYKTDYNPFAKNVIIHNDEDGTDWDVERWIAELSDDDEIVNVLWQVIGAVLRPNVSWNKAAFFFSTRGNNGKGTLCELMRNIVGTGVYTSIPLSDFGKDFMLEGLIAKNAIIVDENDVGTFIDRAANLKAVITNDVIFINRKFKMPIAYQPHCFMVHCLNELPRFKDITDSFYRRQLFIPFDKCFTGHERKYIKDDYLKRQDVLEYVVYRVMNMPDYYTFDDSQSSDWLLAETKSRNNPVVEFWEVFHDQFVWDMLPISFLYDLYKEWYKACYPSGKAISLSNFTDQMKLVSDGWEFREKGNPSSVHHHKMDMPEFLISEYNLTNWMNPVYRGQEKNIICIPALKTQYRNVLVRVS